MPQRRLLFLSASHLAAYRSDGATMSPEGDFAADTAGLEAFGAYLTQHHDTIFSLLADVAEEGFQAEDIPHAFGKDRQSIVTRKLAQYFYGTPLAVAVSRGRRKTGRRDEHLLLMALTQPQHFEPWLERLREEQAILAGIYTLAQIAQRLVPVDAPAQLLLITQTRSGLRQTFFADRQLHFSRLSPLATDSDQEAVAATAVEAEKMHQYLSSQRLIDRARPLATRVLAHPAQLAALREGCPDSATLTFDFADLLQEARRFGLKTAPADMSAEMFFCHMLVRKAPAEQFAPATERRFYRLWQARFALKGISAVILAGGLLFAAWQGAGLWRKQALTNQLIEQARLDQQRYAAVLQALPKIQIPTDDVRALVDRHVQIERRAEGPAPLLAQLSRSLDAFPSIFVDQIEWKIVEQVDAAPPGVNQALASGPYAQAVVAARLPLAMVGDQRGQLALVAEFAKHLGAAPDTQAVILQPPVDTQSGKTLKSGDERSTPEAPKFVFRLTRKL